MNNTLFPFDNIQTDQQGSSPEGNSAEYGYQTRMKVDAIQVQLNSLEASITRILESLPAITTTATQPLQVPPSTAANLSPGGDTPNTSVPPSSVWGRGKTLGSRDRRSAHRLFLLPPYRQACPRTSHCRSGKHLQATRRPSRPGRLLLSTSCKRTSPLLGAQGNSSRSSGRTLLRMFNGRSPLTMKQVGLKATRTRTSS